MKTKRKKSKATVKPRRRRSRGRAYGEREFVAAVWKVMERQARDNPELQAVLDELRKRPLPS